MSTTAAKNIPDKGNRHAKDNFEALKTLQYDQLTQQDPSHPLNQNNSLPTKVKDRQKAE